MVAGVDGDGDEAVGGELFEEGELGFLVSTGAVEGDDDGTADGGGSGGGLLEEDAGDAVGGVGGEGEVEAGEAGG